MLYLILYLIFLVLFVILTIITPLVWAHSYVKRLKAEAVIKEEFVDTQVVPDYSAKLAIQNYENTEYIHPGQNLESLGERYSEVRGKVYNVGILNSLWAISAFALFLLHLMLFVFS